MISPSASRLPSTYSRSTLEDFTELLEHEDEIAQEQPSPATLEIAAAPIPLPPEHSALLATPDDDAPTNTADDGATDKSRQHFDLSDAVVDMLQNVQKNADASIESLARFLSEFLCTMIETHICQPSNRPSPNQLPEIILLMQEVTGTSAPITLTASEAVCADLAQIFETSGQPMPTLVSNGSAAFANGRIVIDWLESRASWDPGRVLQEMERLMRENGLMKTQFS